jgi:hypothetical protein
MINDSLKVLLVIGVFQTVLNAGLLFIFADFLLSPQTITYELRIACMLNRK